MFPDAAGFLSGHPHFEIEIIAVCWHAEMCEAPARFRAFSLQVACQLMQRLENCETGE